MNEARPSRPPSDSSSERPAEGVHPAAAPMGFRVSGRRALAEIGLVVGGVTALVLLVLWGARQLAGHLTPLVPLGFDEAVGAASWRALSPETSRCGATAQRYVERLAAPLVEAAGSPHNFQFTVVQDRSINAFALPGGYVTVNVGLLEQAENGEEVAGVLAHELGHVILRHGTQRVLRQLGGMAVLSLVFGGTDVETASYTLGSLVNTAYDRDQEREADAYGLELLRRAGIANHGLSRFFERLAQASPGVPALLSSHPDPGDRAERTRNQAREYTPTEQLPAPHGIRCRE